MHGQKLVIMSEKTKLSKHLLQMKFMKKTALREATEDSRETQKIDDEHWVLDIPQLEKKRSKYHVEQSHVPCENLRWGRLSFKNFNPSVEKLMEVINGEMELQEADRRDMETSVDDDEMVQRYATLMGPIKHQSSFQDEDMPDSSEDVRLNKKKQFLKPCDK